MDSTFIPRLAAVSLGFALVACLGLSSCGDSKNGANPEGVQPVAPASQPVGSENGSGVNGGTEEPVAHKTAAPKAVYFEGELMFAKRQFSVLKSTTTFQGDHLCRWTLQPVGEGPASQTMTFRWNDLLFERPPEQVQSVQLEGEDTATKMRELELIRAAMFWPDSPRGLQAWEVTTKGTDSGTEEAHDVAASGTLRLLTAAGEDLGSVEMSYGEAAADGTTPGHQEFRLVPAGDADLDQAVRLVVFERFDLANRSWPKHMSLLVGDEVFWTQTVTSLNVQSWFGEKFFLPLEHQDRVEGTGL